jgi:amino acid transporter
VTNVFTVGKLTPLLLFVAVGLFFISPQNYSLAVRPAYSSFSTAMLLMVFAYSGFEAAVVPTGEARDPGRHLPFALLTGIAVVVVLFVLIRLCASARCRDLRSRSAHCRMRVSPF